ncbi:Sm-like protein LSM1B [Striga hermonthica]|uniref:U6 snRNA-associated Sm-like protein LSm1 n=1 Tax=Striga hermonthica TaxID=68872 RepID=A0A9N7N4P1_STRHE|nr:Sm-like protein LSM1B [Striga hermonthica]
MQAEGNAASLESSQATLIPPRKSDSPKRKESSLHLDCRKGNLHHRNRGSSKKGHISKIRTAAHRGDDTSDQKLDALPTNHNRQDTRVVNLETLRGIMDIKMPEGSSMSWAGPEDIYLSTSLASYLDKKLLVLLRDGRKLMGILRSFDQFANAVLEGACERVIVGDLYCDIPLGLYVIRGENVVLIGELDLEKEELPSRMTRVEVTEIKRAQKAERESSELKGTMKRRMDFLDMD